MKRILALLVPLALSAALFLQPAAAEPQQMPVELTNCSATGATLADPQIARMWFNINNARINGGKPALQWSNTLAQSAMWMARDTVPRYGNTNLRPSLIDSLGRDTRTRLTDCGYRSDAGVGSAIARVTIDNPDGVFTIWQADLYLDLYRLIHDIPQSYTVGALATAFNPNTTSPYYPYIWVLDVGTQPDASAPNPTPIPPTATPIPPTQTPFPTALPITPVPTKGPRALFHGCMASVDGRPATANDWPGPFDLDCGGF
jgi:hypothetical protein